MSTVNWDDKTITLEVCPVGFPGIKVTPPKQNQNNPPEIDLEKKQVTLYVKKSGSYSPVNFGQIEINVARTWRDVFCVKSSGGVADIESIVTHVNYFREMGGGVNCGAGGSFAPAPHLTWNSLLANAGTAHSTDMVLNGFFAHNGSDGNNVGYRAHIQGYLWAYVGENIARGQKTIIDVMTAWMNSPVHCANIMNPNFTEVGVGVVDAPDGTKYWTMVLASPTDSEIVDTLTLPCCIENSIWWKRGSNEDGGNYILDDTPTLHITIPGFCQWVMTIARTYFLGPEEKVVATISSLEGTGGGGFVIGNSITENKIVPGMGIKQIDYFEVGLPNLAEVEACQTTYCTCCLTGGTVVGFYFKTIKVGMANGEIVYARRSDHVAWEEGDIVFLMKNEACDDLDITTDACRKACDLDEFDPSVWWIPGNDAELECKYVIVPLLIGDHGD